MICLSYLSNLALSLVCNQLNLPKPEKKGYVYFFLKLFGLPNDTSLIKASIMFYVLEKNKKSQCRPGALPESKGLGAGELPAYAVILRLTFFLT